MAGYKGHLAAGALTGGVAASTVSLFGASLVAGGWIPYKLTVLPPEFDMGYGLGRAGYLAALALLCLLFSLWPDADTDSKGQRLFGTILFCSLVGLMLLKQFKAASLLGILGTLPMMARHRGWTHTWVAMLLVPLPLFLFPFFYLSESQSMIGMPFYIAAVLGYASHLAVDGTW